MDANPLTKVKIRNSVKIRSFKLC